MAEQERAHHTRRISAEQVSPYSVSNRMLGIRAVMHLSGLSRTTIWRRVKCGGLPPPLQISANRVGWPERVIHEWLSGLQPVHYAPAQETAWS